MKAKNGQGGQPNGRGSAPSPVISTADMSTAAASEHWPQAVRKAQRLTGQWEDFTYAGPAGSRPYYVYTPEGCRVGNLVTMIVMLHGCAQVPIDSATGTRWNELAGRHSFITVYPQQTLAENLQACWNWFLPESQERGGAEAAIIAGITQQVLSSDTRWTIDPQRVFVTGMSAGASMATILGATYPDLYAAIGLHSGVEFKAATDALAALPATQEGGPDPAALARLVVDAMGVHARVMPTIVVHGTSDQVVHPINGDQVVQQWMAADRLLAKGHYPADFSQATNTRQGRVPGGHSYTVSQWNDDAGQLVQEYWRIHEMDHAWSGGSVYGSFTDPRGPDVAEAMLTFFRNHPMPPHG